MSDAANTAPPVEAFGDFIARVAHETGSRLEPGGADNATRPSPVEESSTPPPPEHRPAVPPGFDAVRQGADVDRLATLHLRRARELAGSDAGAVGPLVHLVTAAAHLAARHPAAFFNAAADLNQIGQALLADIRRAADPLGGAELPRSD